MAHVRIEFENNQAKFDIATDEDSQMFTVLLGLEAYIASKSGLHIDDIRNILDDMRDGSELKDVNLI